MATSKAMGHLSYFTFMALEGWCYVDFRSTLPHEWTLFFPFKYCDKLYLSQVTTSYFLNSQEKKKKISGIHSATLYNWCLFFGVLFLISSQMSLQDCSLSTISEVTGSLPNVRGSHSHSLGLGPGSPYLSGQARASIQTIPESSMWLLE